MAQSVRPEIKCSICNKPVDLRNCKSDTHGQAVHEECYVLRDALKSATQLPPRPRAS
jgi:hypothetical protein